MKSNEWSGALYFGIIFFICCSNRSFILKIFNERERNKRIEKIAKGNSNEHTTSNAVLYIVNFNFDHAIWILAKIQSKGNEKSNAKATRCVQRQRNERNEQQFVGALLFFLSSISKKMYCNCIGKKCVFFLFLFFFLFFILLSLTWFWSSGCSMLELKLNEV